MFVYKKLCITDCSVPTNPSKPYYHLGECVKECPDNYQGHQGSGACRSDCPIGYYISAATRTCIDKEECNQQGSFIYDSECISDCTVTIDPEKRFYHDGVCVTQCPEQLLRYLNQPECLNSCPPEFYGNTVEQTCINMPTCTGEGRFIYQELCIEDCG